MIVKTNIKPKTPGSIVFQLNSQSSLFNVPITAKTNISNEGSTVLYNKKQKGTYQKNISLSSILTSSRASPRVVPIETQSLRATQVMKTDQAASKLAVNEFYKAKVYIAKVDLTMNTSFKRQQDLSQKHLFLSRKPLPVVSKQSPLESMIYNQMKIKDSKSPRVQVISKQVSRHSVSSEATPQKTPRTPVTQSLVRPNAAENLAKLKKNDQQIKLISNKASFIEEYQTPLITQQSARSQKQTITSHNIKTSISQYLPPPDLQKKLYPTLVTVDLDESEIEQPLQEMRPNESLRVTSQIMLHKIKTNKVPQFSPRKLVSSPQIRTEISGERSKSIFSNASVIKKWHKISIENVEDEQQLTPKSTGPKFNRNSSVAKSLASSKKSSPAKKQFVFERAMEENGRMSVLEEHKTKLILPKDVTKLEDKCIHGWIEKTTQKSMFFNWRRVFVTVEQQKIRYFRDQDQQAQKGVIDFRRIRAKLILVKGECVFQILVKMVNKEQKLFQFKTASKNHLHAWVDVIDANMSLDPFQSVRFDEAPVNFWKLNRISIEEFVRIAQTGDIMLFQGTHMNCRLLQTVSGSKYDHVAALIKYPNSGQVVIFESLQGRGVCKWDWQTLINNNYWQQNYSRIVYRRLLGVERDLNFDKIVKDFMAENVGRNYRLNASILLGQEDEQHGFFCSELVAQLLKNLKLLPNNALPSSYWPGHFSLENLKSQIKLEGDAFYSEEFILDFEI